MYRFTSSMILFAAMLIALGVPAARAAEPRPDAKRPNVLVILTDDQRWDAMSCAGNPYLKAPDIDRLAREGVYFCNAFCTTSLCSPSRASILGGLYAHSHGVSNNFTEYPLHGDGMPDCHKAELYNIKSDPDELKNLIDDPQYAGKVKELQAELHRLMEQTGALTDRMPLDEGIQSKLPDAKIR